MALGLMGLQHQAVQAMFAAMTDDELLRRSDLIVFGEWQGQAALRLGPDRSRVEMGVVKVREVLKGPAGLELVFVATIASGAVRSSSDLVYRRGNRGLWLLHAPAGADGGIYLADHPQRFVDATVDAKRIEVLRKKLN